MSLLLRALACFVVAICMASMSLAAAGHSVMVLDESTPHASLVGAETPCPDCGTHQSIGCGQACSVATDDPSAGAMAGLTLVALDFAVLLALPLHGAALGPPVTPPIA
ncbi:hypothetical protein [Devosia sp.]|jgi:hypothetical protein|uniref:hypothetical protein n=1 Tax=Devosia sp. TaxID=1871048 RepID=UPI003F6F944D